MYTDNNVTQRSSIFWAVTQLRLVVIVTDVSRQTIGPRMPNMAGKLRRPPEITNYNSVSFLVRTNRCIYVVPLNYSQ
jgi:hypothetical protein